VLRSNLSEEDSVVFGVFDIAREISDSSGPSGSLQVIVEPSKKDLIDGEPQEIFNGLAFFQEAVQLRMVDKIDFREQTNLDNLPDETKNEMGFSFHEILRTDVDDIAPDGFGRHDAKVLVLNNSEVVQVLLVEHTFVDGLRDSIIDQFAQEDTIMASWEKGHVISFDGQNALEVSVFLEGVVDVISKCDLLFVRKGMGCGVSSSSKRNDFGHASSKRR